MPVRRERKDAEARTRRRCAMMTGMRRDIGCVFIALTMAVSACGGSSDPEADVGEGLGSAPIESEAQDADAGDADARDADAGESDTQTATDQDAETSEPEDESAAEDQSAAEDASVTVFDPNIDLTGCAVAPPPGFPDAEQFSLVDEEEVFRCFQTDSFVFTASFESEVPAPDQLSSVVLTSTSVEIEEDRRYRATGSADDVDFDLVRIGDLVYVDHGGEQLELDLADEAASFQLLALDSTSAQLTLAGVGLLVVELYGGGAERVGEEPFGDRTAVRWEADGDAIAEVVNSLGVLPGQVEVSQAELVIWTDEFGQVLKVTADLPADAVTVGGVPAIEIAGATDSGLPFGLVYEFEYSQFGEPVTIEAP